MIPVTIEYLGESNLIRATSMFQKPHSLWKPHVFSVRKPTAVMPCPHLPGWFWKQRFHSENTWNVFYPHYPGGILKRNNYRPFSGQGNNTIILYRFQKAPFSNFSDLKSVLEKAPFRDGWVSTLGLVEINSLKAAFTNFSAYHDWTGPFRCKISLFIVLQFKRTAIFPLFFDFFDADLAFTKRTSTTFVSVKHLTWGF